MIILLTNVFGWRDISSIFQNKLSDEKRNENENTNNMSKDLNDPYIVTSTRMWYGINPTKVQNTSVAGPLVRLTRYPVSISYSRPKFFHIQHSSCRRNTAKKISLLFILYSLHCYLLLLFLLLSSCHVPNIYNIWLLISSNR